ncbi:MAG: hypothetical protein C4562_03515 [Actinobacteria bacterium]|nr:MAG: hypothetical protein C4562_03515 [Actinomycetota bacterium]
MKLSTRIFSAILFFAIGIIIIICAPAEQTLGQWVKLVYFHGALIWSTILVFSLSGILGIIFLVTNKLFIFNWAKKSELIAVILLAINLALSSVTMKIIWNAVLFTEPRFKYNVLILLFSSLILSFTYLIDVDKLSAVMYSIIAGLYWSMIILVGRAFHPASAISSSSNLTIKLSFFLSALFFFTAIVLLTLPLPTSGNKLWQ